MKMVADASETSTILPTSTDSKAPKSRNNIEINVCV
jgi:hypothetical protein